MGPNTSETIKGGPIAMKRMESGPAFGKIAMRKLDDWRLLGHGSWEGVGQAVVEISYGRDHSDIHEPVEKGTIHVNLYREHKEIKDQGWETVCHVTFRREGLLKRWNFDKVLEQESGLIVNNAVKDEWEKAFRGLMKSREAKDWLKYLEEHYDKMKEFKVYKLP